MKLSIAEGLYLIAMDDEEGRLLAAAEKTIVPGLISACILELHLLKKVQLVNGKISVLETGGTGNGILDNVLKKIKSGSEFIDTVDHLAHHFKDIQGDLNELLVQRGILKREATKLMWIPLSERLDNANYGFEQEIRNGLKVIVFKNAKPSPAFVILMSLIYDCNILDEVFKDKDELVDAVKKAKDIVNNPEIDNQVSSALKELKAHFGK